MTDTKATRTPDGTESRWRATAERLEVALEASCQGWYEVAPIDGDVSVSAAYLSILGEPADREPITFEEWSRRLHPEDRERVLRDADAVHGGSLDRFEDEYRFRVADGSYRWIADLGRVAERGVDGRARRIVGVIRDVTDRKEAEIEVRRSAEEHRRLFETMAQGVVYQAASGEIVAANPAAERILGLSLEEMRGRLSSDPGWRALREDGTDFPGEEHPAMVALETGREIDGVVMGIHNPAEGRLRWILVDARPIFRDGEKKPFQVYFSFTDVTALRESERALRESEEKYRAFVENTPDIVSRIDRDLRIVFVSRSVGRYVPGGAEAVVGKRIPEIEGIPPEAGERMEASIRAVFENGDSRTESLRFDGPEGTVNFEWRLFPERDEDGGIATVVSIVRDYTAERQLEHQFRETQKMEAIGQLAGGVAHDFNNLLTVMRGHSELALGALAAGDPLREDMVEVVRATDRATALTRQLLAFGRRQVMETKVVDMGEIVSGIEKMVRRLISEHIALEVDVAPDPHPVRVDPGQMEQVLMNLVVNARDALGETGGTIRVRVRDCRNKREREVAPHGWVCVDVEDDGAGMDPETVERIFEPFFTTKRDGEGTGLGLSTVYGIVRQSRGWVDVESEPGRGSVFTVGIPAVDEEVIDVAERDEEGTGPEPGGETVLVVEDDEAVRDLARRVLESRGYAVIDATDAVEALEILERGRRPIDLLLTDVVMPGMSGKELVRRARRWRPGLRALLMTGYDSEAASPGGARLPAPLLRKPFSPAELGRVVAEVLAESPTT